MIPMRPAASLPSALRTVKHRLVKMRVSTAMRGTVALAGVCLAMPTAADSVSAPPSAAELLARVVERAKGESDREAAFKARYAFTRDRVLEVRDGSGKLQKRDARRVEHKPAQPAKQSGATPPEDRPPTAQTGGKPRAYQRRDFQLDHDLIARFRFDPPQGENIGDRGVWRLNFQPAVDGPSGAGINERFLSKIAGSAWVDALDHELVRVEIQLTAPVPVVGGLVGSVKKCRVLIERERTEEDCWFTRRLTWHLEGRQFFSARVMDFTEEIQNVRSAETLLTEPVARP